MSKHSKHGRGKHFRRNQIRQMQSGTSVTPPAAGNIPMATAPTAAAVPISTPIPMPQVSAQRKPLTSAALPLQYHYVVGELKRIGIFTAVIVAILIVLYLFLK
jgi:hypothetical protein